MTPHLNCPSETVLMIGHKICFHEEIWLIIPKLSFLSGALNNSTLALNCKLRIHNLQLSPKSTRLFPTMGPRIKKLIFSNMGDMGASMIRDLAAAIIRDGKVPSDWEQSFIVCLYKGKGDALERGNYRGLKLTEQVMKVLERIVDGLIRQVVSIDDSQFGFVPGRGTTDAIFVVRQLQEKYLAANKRLHGFRRP